MVSVYTASGIERIMSGAKDQDEAARIAENLRAGGYTDIVIRKTGVKLTSDRNLEDRDAVRVQQENIQEKV